METCLAEGTQTSQDTSSDPRRVLPLRRRKDLYPHVFDGEFLYLGQESVAKAPSQGAAARKDDVAIKGFSQVEVGPVNGVNDHLMNAGIFLADDFRVEKDLGGAESLSTDLEEVTLVDARGFMAAGNAERVPSYDDRLAGCTPSS